MPHLYVKIVHDANNQIKSNNKRSITTKNLQITSKCTKEKLIHKREAIKNKNNYLNTN